MAKDFTVPPPKGYLPSPTPTPKRPHKGPLNIHHAMASNMLEQLMGMKGTKHIVVHHFKHGESKNA